MLISFAIYCLIGIVITEYRLRLLKSLSEKENDEFGLYLVSKMRENFTSYSIVILQWPGYILHRLLW